MNVVSEYSFIDIIKWSDFVKNHKNGNMFQTPEMFNVFKDTKNYEPVLVAAIDDDGNILGILLAVIQKEFAGLYGDFTARAIILGGPLIRDNNTDVLDFILKNYNKIIKQEAIYSQFRNMSDYLFCNDIFQENGFFFESHLNYVFQLKKGKEYIWNNIHKSRKKKIKKSIRNGLTINVYKDRIDDNYINKGYDIIKEVYNNAKLPIADISLIKNANNNNLLVIFLVEYQKTIIGCRFALCYNNLIYGWFSGSYSKYYHLFPNDLLIWKTLEWGIENDYDYFDYGGAGNPNKPYGVRKFKSQLGGDLVNFGRYEKVHKPILMSIGKMGLKFWQKIKK